MHQQRRGAAFVYSTCVLLSRGHVSNSKAVTVYPFIDFSRGTHASFSNRKLCCRCPRVLQAEKGCCFPGLLHRSLLDQHPSPAQRSSLTEMETILKTLFPFSSRNTNHGTNQCKVWKTQRNRLNKNIDIAWALLECIIKLYIIKYKRTS